MDEAKKPEPEKAAKDSKDAEPKKEFPRLKVQKTKQADGVSVSL